jgi:hypothetical protein
MKGHEFQHNAWHMTEARGLVMQFEANFSIAWRRLQALNNLVLNTMGNT